MWNAADAQKFSVSNGDQPVSEPFGEEAFVRNHYDGHAKLCLELSKQREDRFARGGIEIARGLVGQKNLWAIDKSASNGHALLLAAGKFRRPMAKAMREMHVFESFTNPASAFGTIDFGKAKRKFDVFLESHTRKQVEGLENHANGVATVASEVQRSKLREVFAVGEDGTRCGPVQASHEIQ